MSHQQDIKDVSTVITSILASKKPPYGIPLVKLDQDYYEFENQRIPYRRLGFSSLVDFIKTIPEVEIYPRGTSHFIDFNGKNSTRHITDLVAKQRKPSFKNRSRSVCTRKTAPAMYRPRESSSSSSSIDPKVTSHISSIIHDHPSGIMQSELIEKLVYKRPYLHLNTFQCNEHLRILDREVVIKDNLIYPKNSSSIPRDSSFAERSTRSKSVPPKRHFNNNNNYNNNNSNNNNGEYYDKKYEDTNGKYCEKSYDNNYQYVENNHSTNGNYTHNNYQDNYSNAGNDKKENSYQSSVLSNNFKVGGIDSDDNYEVDDIDLDEGDYVTPSAPSANGIQRSGDSVYNDKYEVKDVKNGDTHQNGRSVEQVQSYGNLTKYEDKKVNFEADRQLEFINATGVAGGDEVDKKEALFNRNKEYIAESLSKRTALRLEKLLENNPNGIWCFDLPKLYREDYQLTLEWEDFGFQRLSDFVSHLPKIFHMVGPYRNGDYRLFDAKKPLPDDNFQNHQKPTMASLYDIYGDNDNDDSLPQYISPDIKQTLCPDDVLAVNETVGHISVTRFEPEIDANGEKIMKSIGVYVVEAFNPSFFWVQISKYKRKFDEMMEDLGKFYDANSAKYKIPLIILEKGLNIACKFFGKWHRGIIKSVSPSNSRVSVMFYDYGTLKSYRPEEVFFLHRRFGVLDAQAIPCGLCFIKPRKRESDSHDEPSNEWTKEARTVFLHMAFKCEMWATIFKVDVDNNSMLIGLTDTSGDEDLHIADYLLHKKFAERSKTVRITTRNFHYTHSKISSIEWKQKSMNSSLGNARLTKMNNSKSSNKFLSANQKANQTSLQNSNNKNPQRHGETLSPSMLREIAKSKVKNSKPVELPPPPIVLNYAPTPTINLLPLGSSHDKVNLWFELNNELNENSDAGDYDRPGDHSFEGPRLKKVPKSDNFKESKLQRVPEAFKLEDIFKMSECRITSKTVESHRDPETSKAQCISSSSKNLFLPKVSSSEDHKSVGSRRLANLIDVLDKNEKVPGSGTFSSPLRGRRKEESVDRKNVRHFNKNGNDYSASSKCQTSSDESSNKNRPSTLSHQGVSKLLTAFGDDDDDDKDQVPESGTFGSPLGGHGREEPIDWNAVRQMVNKDEVKVQAKSEPVKEEILPAGANRKSQPVINKSYLNDKAHKYFDNFYESCVASKFTNGNPTLSWESEDEIKYTGVITPMVRQTLNTINKNSDSVKVTVPVNVRRLIEKSSNSSSEETSSDSKNSGWNSPSDRRISQPLKINDIDNKSDSDSRSSDSTKQVPTIHKLLKARHLNKINKTSEDDDNDNKETNDKPVECQPEEKKKVLIEELPTPKSSPKSRTDQKKNVNSIYYASARISLCKKINRLQDGESSGLDDVDLDSDDSSFYEEANGEKPTSVSDNDDSEEIGDKNDRDEEKLDGKLDSEEIDDKNDGDEEKLNGKLDSEENSAHDKNDNLDKNDTDDNQDVDEGTDPSAESELKICPSPPVPRFNDADVDSNDSELGYHLPLDFLAHFFGVKLPPQAGITNSSADTDTDTDGRSEDEGVQIDEVNCDDEKPHSSESSSDISSARANQSATSRVETDSESSKNDLRAGNKKQFAKVSNQLEPKKKFEFKKDDEETTVQSTPAESDFRDTDEEKIKKTQGYKLKCSLVNEVKKSGLLESPKFVKNCALKFNADEFLDVD